jgi:hypothetical protein
MSSVKIDVDLRGKFPQARNQGKRPSCLACAVSDAHARAHSLPYSLSAEFLFYRAVQAMPRKDPKEGLTFSAAHSALNTHGQPKESDWTYQKKQPASWVLPTVGATWHGGLTAAAVSDISNLLKNGTCVVLGVRLTSEFLDKILPPPYVISTSTRGVGGHAVLAVGTGHSVSAGNMLLIRNSWGTRWGMKGHAWLSEGFLAANTLGCRRVAARP